jgi:hypothetical protein
MNILEIEVYSGDQNIAPLGVASSSSVYTNSSASNVNDQNMLTVFNSITQNDRWVEIDLGEEILITRIVVYNQTYDYSSGRIGGDVLTVYDQDRAPVYQSDPFPLTDGSTNYSTESGMGYPVYTVYPPNKEVTHS